MTSVKPQIPRWLTRPEPVKVRIEECHWDPWGGEAVVVIRIGKREVQAWVPRYAVTEDPVAGSTVRGVKIAETDDHVYVAMPPSTITSPNLKVPKSLQVRVFAA